MKKIGNTWYNVEHISQMSFEEFCSIIPSKTKEIQENLYFQITGKKNEPVIEKKRIKKEVVEEIKEDVKE